MHRTTTVMAEILDLQPATAPDLVCTVLKHGHNDGARLVASFGVELPEPGGAEGVSGYVGSADVDALLRVAARVADDLGDDAIGPEHVILATLADESIDPEHAGLFKVLVGREPLFREQLARLRAGRTDLLAPEADEAFLAEVEQQLYRLAD